MCFFYEQKAKIIRNEIMQRKLRITFNNHCAVFRKVVCRLGPTVIYFIFIMLLAQNVNEKHIKTFFICVIKDFFVDFAYYS